MQERTFPDRVSHYYLDNKDYLNSLFDRYKSFYYEYYELPYEELHKYEDGKVEGFKNYMKFKIVEEMINPTNQYGPYNSSEMSLVADFIDYGYVDFPDFKANVKPINLGTSIGDVDKIKKYICGGKSIGDGIIMPDGSFYKAKGMHYLLNNWLLLNGKDTAGAVRVATHCGNTTLLFSDLKGYCEMDHDLKITEKQAYAIYNFYRLNKSTVKKPFQDIIFESFVDGFLCGDSVETSKYNIQKLEKAVNAIIAKQPVGKTDPKDMFNARSFEHEFKEYRRQNLYKLF